MGQNLILNVADHKEFNVVCFNRSVDKVDKFLKFEAKGLSVPVPPNWRRKALLMLRLRLQKHRGSSFSGGVRPEAQETPSHHAPRHGRQAS